MKCAMRSRIDRATAEQGQKLLKDMRKNIIITTLYTLATVLNVKKPTLLKFFNAFDDNFTACAKKYDYERKSDVAFAMQCELSRLGINVDELIREYDETHKEDEDD